MILNKKTLEKLRNLINEETEYRSGPQIIKFFNSLGFNDKYGDGFPSRWIYTDEKLNVINGKPEIDKCIKNLFAPQNFIGRFDELDNHIEEFNQYLAFDDWKVVRNGREIIFKKADEIDFSSENDEPQEDSDGFLKTEFESIAIDKLGLDGTINNVLNTRLEEIKGCIGIDAPLSVIFLCGSTLEGILLGFALKNPKEFNQAKAAPKNDNKVKNFQEWTLANMIDVAYEIGFLKEDVKKFSHSLRDFRNYIHPFAQMSSMFDPSEHTAKISFQVLKAAIFQLSEKRK